MTSGSNKATRENGHRKLTNNLGRPPSLGSRAKPTVSATEIKKWGPKIASAHSG